MSNFRKSFVFSIANSLVCMFLMILFEVLNISDNTIDFLVFGIPIIFLILNCIICYKIIINDKINKVVVQLFINLVTYIISLSGLLILWWSIGYKIYPINSEDYGNMFFFFAMTITYSVSFLLSMILSLILWLTKKSLINKKIN
ncbi:hypothetical protein [Clostridium sp. UBA4548]|uniref:hypothetical protein n=1 Tax=Clostridium sp. UBA4548 TaxID=1946361 RepID=UPI0025B8A44C|nr:hypothetical protein [Clostridium sp. UBA4548]